MLESEIARQMALARVAVRPLDIARGETEGSGRSGADPGGDVRGRERPGRYQVGASTGAPDGTLIWWVLRGVEPLLGVPDPPGCQQPVHARKISGGAINPKSGMQPVGLTHVGTSSTTRLATGVPPRSPRAEAGRAPLEDRVNPAGAPGLRLPTAERAR